MRSFFILHKSVLIMLRVSDTRRGVGQNMSMDIIRRDGCPLRMSPCAGCTGQLNEVAIAFYISLSNEV